MTTINATSKTVPNIPESIQNAETNLPFQIKLLGVIEIGGIRKVSLSLPGDERSFWVKMNQTRSGITPRHYDEAASIVYLEINDHYYQLPLKAADPSPLVTLADKFAPKLGEKADESPKNFRPPARMPSAKAKSTSRTANGSSRAAAGLRAQTENLQGSAGGSHTPLNTKRPKAEASESAPPPLAQTGNDLSNSDDKIVPISAQARRLKTRIRAPSVFSE